MNIKEFIVTICCILMTGCATKRAEFADDERTQAAELALLCADVMDTHRGSRDLLNPVVPSWTGLAKNWVIDGHIVGTKRVSITGPLGSIVAVDAGRAIYGVLAHRSSDTEPYKYTLAIRGTDAAEEWQINTFADKVQFSAQGGGVHKGFYSIYSSFGFVAAGEPKEVRTPAWQQIANYIGAGSITITGHSLGAALAIYLSAELGANGMSEKVRGRYFAAPRSGDSNFIVHMRTSVPDYVVYNNSRDIIPELPPSLLGLIYRKLDTTKTIEENQFSVVLRNSPTCNHSAISYAAILNGNRMPLQQWQDRFSTSGGSGDCILGVAERDR